VDFSRPFVLRGRILKNYPIIAEAGKPWAGGKSVRKRKTHRRTRSGREVPIPPHEQEPDETTGLLDGERANASGQRGSDTGGGKLTEQV
jgi:hypothetical protein